MAEGDPDKGGFDARADLVASAGGDQRMADAEDGSDGQRS
jgi:hypothetical protein